MKPHISLKRKAASQRPAPRRLNAKALASQVIPSSQAAALRGGDGDDNRESYPWVDQP
jgi:hypothetical protein